ncbi:MAG: polysaccharide deacetylase family protein [candidate division WOR-3 bacterium]
MRSLLIIFLISIALTVSTLFCGSSDTTGQEGPDTTQPDTTLHDTTNYPAPDKLCALTFDDGPDTNLSNQVLDKLEYYQITASFFVIGQKINSTTKPVLEREVSLGCEIGNHSWGYESMTSMDSAQIVTSVENTTDAIEENAGVSPHFFRPPNLAVDNLMYEVIDFPFAGGGVVAYDWQGGGADTPEDVARNVIRDVLDGAIILLHDVQPLPHPTPEALDSIITTLRNMGYEFVTLSDLFDRKGVDPDVENKMWTVVQ